MRKRITMPILFMLATLIAGLMASSNWAPANAQTQSTAVFDFDTGTPIIPARSNTPFDQTSNGVTAHFTSIFDPNAFSLQNSATTTYVLSQFSGNYLYQNSVSKTPLQISFNQALTSISMKFATVDYHDPVAGGNPSFIRLTAYLNSEASPPVGSVQTFGVFTTDTYPEGTLSFTSSQPFNLVIVDLPFLAQGATTFFVDTVTVTTASTPPPAPVPMYAAVRGLTDEIWYRTYSSGTSTWNNWTPLPTQTTIDSPAIAQLNGKLYFAVRDPDGLTLRFGSVNLANGTFSGWTILSGSTRSAPTLVTHGSSLVLLFTDVTTNNVFYNLYDTVSGVWAGLVNLGRTSCGGPAAAVIGDVLHLVVLGFSPTNAIENVTMYYASLNLVTSAWSPWTALPGYTDAAPRLTTPENQNMLYLVVKGLDWQIWINIWDGTAWQGWNALPTGLTTRSPAATIINGELHVLVRSAFDNAIWQYHINLTNGIGSGWAQIGGLTPSAPTLTR